MVILRPSTVLLTIVLALPLLLTSSLSQVRDDVKVAVEPAFVEKAQIDFPEEAREASVAGKVWVKVMLDKEGKPVKTEILKRDPEIAYMFDEATRRWAMRCRFSPAKDSLGNPVRVWVTVPLNFKIEGFEPPVLTKLVDPEIPEDALSMGLEGWVGVAVLVSESGNALNGRTVIVARDPPMGKVFDEAAKDAVKASDYRPAVYRGRKVDGWCFVKVVFSLPGR